MTTVTPVPQFVDSSGRRIFTLYFPAASAGDSSVLLIPPFADEMNKSRRMYSELARKLSSENYNVLMFDFYGTGDSDGLLEEASWQHWLDDIKSCLSHLHDKVSGGVSLVAMRTGALLAAEYLNSSEAEINKLLLWQPVIDGKVFFNQFMRLRLASSMMSGDKDKETSKDLKAILDAGESLEIAGYMITPSLANSLEAASLKNMDAKSDINIAWFDVVADEQKEAPLMNRKLVELWQQAGMKVEHNKVVGMAFWSSTEIVEIPTLLDHSIQFLTSNGAG